MAHFFIEGGAQTPTNIVRVGVGKAVQVAVWGANVNGQFLTPNCNDSSIAAVTSKGTNAATGMIRNIVVNGRREGNVMLEARLGPSGPVWAFTQVVVSKVAAASAVGVQAVAVAREELALGVYEDEGNTNTGTRVDAYEQLFGMNGLAWCAMFVYWCFNSAAKSMGVANPLPKIAAAQALLTWAQKNNRLVTDPVAGDVLIVKPGSHVGLVVGPPSGGKVPSIEGNTWSHGTVDNHKDGVYPKSHALASCYYLRV
jgi:hypothetical protein